MAVPLLFGCCGENTISPSERAEFLGSWTLHSPKGAKATLTFNNDGTFSATSIPSNTFYVEAGESFPTTLDQLHWKDLKSFQGTWSLSKGDSVYLVMSGSEPSESTALYPATDPGKHALAETVGAAIPPLEPYFDKSSR